MSLRATLLLFCFALFIGGGELLWQSTGMAEWADSARAQSLQTWDPPAATKGPAYEAYNKRWYAAMKELRTDKWPYHDAGSAIMALAVCLAASLFLLKIKSGGDIGHLMTPRSGWTIYAIAALGWFGYAASATIALLQGFDRFEFPPWDDSLVVPIVAIASVAVIGWAIISVTLWLVLRHAPLPAPIWLWRRDMPAHDWIYSAVAAVATLLAAEILRETYLYGHWTAVPCVFLSLYAAYCFRAVGIARGR
jgi:hypothetical protein